MGERVCEKKIHFTVKQATMAPRSKRKSRTSRRGATRRSNRRSNRRRSQRRFRGTEPVYRAEENKIQGGLMKDGFIRKLKDMKLTPDSEKEKINQQILANLGKNPIDYNDPNVLTEKLYESREDLREKLKILYSKSTQIPRKTAETREEKGSRIRITSNLGRALTQINHVNKLIQIWNEIAGRTGVQNEDPQISKFIIKVQGMQPEGKLMDFHMRLLTNLEIYRMGITPENLMETLYKPRDNLLNELEQLRSELQKLQDPQLLRQRELELQTLIKDIQLEINHVDKVVQMWKEPPVHSDNDALAQSLSIRKGHEF